MRKIIFTFIFVMLCVSLPTAIWADLDVTFNINTTEERSPISPYIFGSNFTLGEDENLAARRIGGNRLTGYNWENNYSNAGADWYHHSDQYLVRDLPTYLKEISGIVLTDFHDSCIQAGMYSLVTLQMAGYVSADKNGTVTEQQTAPSYRWKEVIYAKPTPFCNSRSGPDLSDDYVYMDECVNFLVERYGDANTPKGIKGYSLDNEPALWSHTHPRIHPDQPTCQELIDRSVALASAIKDVDPYAEIFGPVLYGFSAFESFQSAPDWSSVRNGCDWFLDYYLDQMKQASDRQQRRLLDVLDLHWYPEARGGGNRITDSLSSYSRENAEARMQAPRTLWDPDYIEDSWIGQWRQSYLPILPNILNSIDTYYPETALAITEFNYGAPEHFSGGIAMADVLGIFIKYGLYMSNYWGDDGDYVSAAYKIYRNYDGNNSTFGDIKVEAIMSDKQNSSIYASVSGVNDSKLHLIAINKNFAHSINAIFNINSRSNYISARVWAFGSSSSDISEISPVEQITNNSFSYTICPLTVCHIILEAEIAPPSQATNPNPADIAVDISRAATLSWIAGTYAGSHDVYFGGDFNSVYDADISLSEYRGSQAGTTFRPGIMAKLKTYYWRIDERNSHGTTKGQVWSFTASDEDLPITFDNASSCSSGTAGTTISWSHTIGCGKNRLLVVGLAAKDTNLDNLRVSSIKYNGFEMSLVEGSSLVVGNQYLHKAELYYLLQENLPLPGTYVVEVIYPGNVDSVSAGAVSLFNVAQQPAEAVAVNSERCSQTISTGITTATDGAWIIDVVSSCTNGSFCSIDEGMEAFWSTLADGSSAAGSTKAVPSAGLTTMGWQHCEAGQLIHSLAAFAPTQCPIGDISDDCEVDCQDLAALCEQWLQSNGKTDLDGVNGVNMLDFALLAEDWLN
jgi:hypothetical protein